jgi:serine/threonine protein kinase
VRLRLIFVSLFYECRLVGCGHGSNTNSSIVDLYHSAVLNVAARATLMTHRPHTSPFTCVTGNLQNILKAEQQEAEGDDASVTLEDFDLLAVLGRGGFGKVMQVRHRNTDTVYAMKILKKSELRRRRQVG